jgi:hypothetical protein
MDRRQFLKGKGDKKMFLKRNSGKNASGPEEVPRFLSRRIGEDWGKLPHMDGHWVRYKMVTRPQADKTEVFDFRIFDEGYTEAKGIKILDYASLDGYPDLVFLDGWFNKKSKESEIKLPKAA